MREFVRENRKALDDAILGAIYRHNGRGGPGTVPMPRPKLNDEERRGWIQNDESLWEWAQAEGVR